MQKFVYVLDGAIYQNLNDAIEKVYLANGNSYNMSAHYTGKGILFRNKRVKYTNGKRKNYTIKIERLV